MYPGAYSARPVLHGNRSRRMYNRSARFHGISAFWRGTAALFHLGCIWENGRSVPPANGRVTALPAHLGSVFPTRWPARWAHPCLFAKGEIMFLVNVAPP